MGALSPHQPRGMLSLLKVVQGSLCLMLRATIPTPSPAWEQPWGRGKESRACCSPPPSAPGHCAVLSTGRCGFQLQRGFLNPIDAMPPHTHTPSRQEPRGHIGPRLGQRSGLG